MFLLLRRFLARLFDYGFFYLGVVLVALILPIELDHNLLVLFSLFVPFIWAPIEAFLLYLWRTTPGKKLFGLSVPKLTWKESFERAFFLTQVRTLEVKEIGFKRHLVALLLACAAGSVLFLGDDISEAVIQYEGRMTTSSGWIQYISDNGKFQVDFPKEPKQESQTFAVPNEEPINLSEFKASTTSAGKAEFSVSYLDLPRKWRLFSSNTLLKGAMGVVLEHLPGTELIEKKIVTHKNYPAMDFRVKDGENEISGRLILVGNTLYKLWVVYFPGTPRDERHEPFLDSFELKE